MVLWKWAGFQLGIQYGKVCLVVRIGVMRPLAACDRPRSINA